MRLYTSAVRKGVRVPKMLTVDERFEAIVSGAYRDVRADKMQPMEEPTPKEGTPAKDEGKPEKKEEK